MSRLMRCFLLVGAVVWPAPVEHHAFAQDLNAMLLRQICEAKDIRGHECADARDYPAGSPCNVKLSDTRHVGRYLASQTIVLVGYESECEPRAQKFGGSIVFEQAGEGYRFNSYQPGFSIEECISLPKRAGQDRLVCLTSGMGQGFIESSVSEVVFTRDASQSIDASFDELVTALDTAGAFGANKIECKAARVLFGFLDIAPGPTADTVLVTVEYADRRAIAQACRPGARIPRDVVDRRSLGKGEAFIDEKALKTGRFSLDLGKRRLQPK